jgi:hypothetical protein
MIVYREQQTSADARGLLRDLQSRIAAVAAHVRPSRHLLLHALVDAGEWAAAVADAGARECDRVDPVASACAVLVDHLADATDAVWCGRTDHAAAATARAAASARDCERSDLPRHVTRRVSEGFAYYAVGPELYADAARTWGAQRKPRMVWCLGLRTIGLTLASVVAAALRNQGVQVQAVSLRPRGHPFDRRPVTDAALVTAVMSVPDAWYLLVDEGPGLSGSSLAGTARWLTDLGIGADRVVLMPSYLPELGRLPEPSRTVWQRHAIVPAADFEATWISSQKLARDWDAMTLADVSGGAWRQRTKLTRLPAAHPHHERRKFLARKDGTTTLLKFVGYGRYGQRLAERARGAAAAAWAPHTSDARSGWMEAVWRGEPASEASVTIMDLDHLAEYIAFIAETRQTDAASDIDRLAEMTRLNLEEVCGSGAARAVDAVGIHEPPALVSVDGRLRPHEWVRTSERLLKTDGVEHGDDHFFPGPCDIAWDVAGAIEEWRLGSAAADHLVHRCAAATRDRLLSERLPFYRLAYLSFRAAYTAFCRDQLRGSLEAARFTKEHRHYRSRLETMLPCAC